MSPVIRIPSNIYSRLEKHAQGFDTPANVIEKLLDSYEGIQRQESGLNTSQVQSTEEKYAKYSFEGGTYGKGKLVLAVVRAYVTANPDTSFSDLLAAFPKSLQGSHGVFGTKDEAEEISRRTGHKRHFIEPSELVQLSDSVIAVSNQWGAGNIGNFIRQAQSLGYSIVQAVAEK